MTRIIFISLYSFHSHLSSLLHLLVCLIITFSFNLILFDAEIYIEIELLKHWKTIVRLENNFPGFYFRFSTAPTTKMRKTAEVIEMNSKLCSYTCWQSRFIFLLANKWTINRIHIEWHSVVVLFLSVAYWTRKNLGKCIFEIEPRTICQTIHRKQFEWKSFSI